MLFTKRFRDLILYKVYADLRAESSRTYLGFLWWILEPAIMVAIFYVLLALVMGTWSVDAIPVLLVGFVAWKWFETSVKRGADSIRQNRGLMQQVHLSKVFFPVVTVLTESVRFLFAFAVLIAFVLIRGNEVNVYYATLPLVLLSQLLLMLGLALLFAAVVPFLPDLLTLIESCLRVGFFVSGVMFSAIESSPLAFEEMTDLQRKIFYLNPVANCIDAMRMPLLHNGYFPLLPLLYVGLLGIGLAIIGILIIQKYDYTYPRLVS